MNITGEPTCAAFWAWSPPHNGNLTNAETLKAAMFKQDLRETFLFSDHRHICPQ
jgi:hypothetical protein